MGNIYAGVTPKTAAYTVTSSAAPVVAASAGNKRAIGNGIEVYALTTNTAIVYIGGSDLTSANGRPLSPGASVSWPLDDPSKVYAICATASQELRITWI
jgi:hypothetical protein